MTKENLVFSGETNPIISNLPSTITTTPPTTSTQSIPIPIPLSISIAQSPSLMLPNSPLMLAVRDVEGAIKKLTCGGITSTSSTLSPRTSTSSPPTIKKHDTFSAKILLEMKNTLSSSTPSSPIPTLQPPSPSSIIDLISNTANNNNDSGDNIKNTTSSSSSPPPPPPPPTPIYPRGSGANSNNLLSSPVAPHSPWAFHSPNINNTNHHINGAEPAQCVFKECILCKRGSPFANNQSPTWACIMKIVFYCLQIEMPQKPFLNLKTDVYGFMTAHWTFLCLDKKRSDNWHKQIQDMLSHSKNLFESGMEQYKQNGYWRMRQISDPWNEIKAKKIITKRKRSYSENDSSTMNKDTSNNVTGTPIPHNHYSQRDILHSPKSSSSSTNTSIDQSTSTTTIKDCAAMNKLTSVAFEDEIINNINTASTTATSTSSSDDSKDEVLLGSSPINSPVNNIVINESSTSTNSSNTSTNNSLNNSSNNNHILYHSSIDKQIHENFNQLTTQLKIMKETSSLSSNSLLSTSPPTTTSKGTRHTGQRKRAHTESNINNGNSMPPLPMIPMMSGFLYTPNNQNTLIGNAFDSVVSPRNNINNNNNNNNNNNGISSPRGANHNKLNSSSPSNNNLSLPTQPTTLTSATTTPTTTSTITQSNSEVSSSNSSNNNTPPLPNMDTFAEELMDSSSSSPTSPLSSSSSTTTVNNSTLTTSTTTTSTTTSSTSDSDKITQLREHLRQVTDNLRSIKDNSLTADRDLISSMINKEIDRISSILQPSTTTDTEMTIIKSADKINTNDDDERSVPIIMSSDGLTTLSDIIFSSSNKN